jgi:hypothetical protein
MSPSTFTSATIEDSYTLNSNGGAFSITKYFGSSIAMAMLESRKAIRNSAILENECQYTMRLPL